MKTLTYCLLVLAALSCGRSDSSVVSPANDTVADEYPNWYVLKAPVDRDIEGVWGDIDRTLLISTMSTIYRSTDRGKHWESVKQQSTGMFSVVQYNDTLYTMSGLRNGKALNNPDNYSVDDGKTWQPYQRYNPGLEYDPKPGVINRYLEINPVVASTGTAYKINQVFLGGPTATTGTFETPGVTTNTAQRIDLPNLHQLNSLYLDKQQRLYIAGTDAVCSRAGTNEPFRFCNSKQGRGVVYVSKRPLP
ncbi:beta propeller repeat protein [Spirosoma rhododendri]|uniref:Exo-alpha-sialidase n=1 Tax=Spirosoma rhododendri TaxID=2728024 RepID=A0A7L5DRY3_9BACT|nr:hypothetical protein [Spirosoma rhododendri]QJD80003.1 hypothetical protein HH216_17490 [Spirosoma rhododendri]